MKSQEDEELVQQVIAGLTLVNENDYKKFKRELISFLDKRIKSETVKKGFAFFKVYSVKKKEKSCAKLISIEKNKSYAK